MRAFASRWTGVFALLLTLTADVAHAASPFDTLLPLVPADANVLVLIDVERIRSSAIAKNQKFSGEEPGDTDLTIIPPREVRQAVLAQKIRGFRESLRDWQAAVLALEADPSLTGLAAEFGGSLDTIAGQETVRLPNGGTALSVAPRSLSVLAPFDRHRVGKFVALSKTSKPAPIDPFLSTAAASMGLKTHVLVAMDLQEMFSSSQILLYLREAKAFESRPMDLNAATRLAAGIRGMTLSLGFTDSVQGQLTLEFSGSTEGTSEWTKALLLELFADIGATIEDLESWSFSRGDKSISLKGELSLPGVRRVLALIDFPTRIPQSALPNAELSDAERQKLTARATLERFKATERLYLDLRNPAKTRQLTTAEYGLWYDKYARKIETLPSRFVDKDLLAWSDDLVLKLRVLSTKSRLVGIKAGAYSRSSNYVTNFFSTWYGGYYETRQLESEFDYIQRVERASNAADKFALYEEIDRDTLAIRRQMTERYGVEF